MMVGTGWTEVPTLRPSIVEGASAPATERVPPNFERTLPSASGSKICALTLTLPPEAKAPGSPPRGVASKTWVAALGYAEDVSAEASKPRKGASQHNAPAATATKASGNTRAFLGIDPSKL